VQLRSTEQKTGLLQAEAALREATAREAEVQTRYQRINDMYVRKVVPKATLDEVAANRDAAVARLSAARAAVEGAREGVAYTEVRAPYAGVVTKRLVQVGETVSPGTPLVSGLSLQYLRVVVDVPQSIVSQVRRLKKAAIYVEGRRIEATKVTVFTEGSSPTNTFRARLELPENDRSLSGDVREGCLRNRGGRSTSRTRQLTGRAQRSDCSVRARPRRVDFDAPGADRRPL